MTGAQYQRAMQARARTIGVDLRANGRDGLCHEAANIIFWLMCELNKAQLDIQTTAIEAYARGMDDEHRAANALTVLGMK